MKNLIKVLNGIKLVIALTAMQLLFISDSALASNAESFMSKNVNVVDENYSYKDDIDDSRFRLKVYKSKGKSIALAMNTNKSNLCNLARSYKKFNFTTSSDYIVSILKKADAIRADDKNYAFKSAHFLWEYYLTYRDFVDVSRSFKDTDPLKVLSKLPEGYILLVEKSCVKNGAVTLMCKGEKLYTKRFPNYEKLKTRLTDSSIKNCKIGRDVKIIVEAKRFYSSL